MNKALKKSDRALNHGGMTHDLGRADTKVQTVQH